MKIVTDIYQLARQHEQIKGFRYGRTGGKGAGTDIYPLVWVDDPVLGDNPQAKIMRYTVNFDVLDIPKDSTVLEVQANAELVGLAFAEKLRPMYSSLTVSMVSLSEYTDDNAAGQRVTIRGTMANPVNKCGDPWLPNKELETPDLLPKIDTTDPSGCTVFADKKGFPKIITT